MVIKYLPVREDSGDVSLREFQRRMTEIGRIRLGVFNPNKGNRGAPDKLSTFRFTSGMAEPIVKIADLYGGEARQYTPQRGTGVQWECVTEVDAVPVYVPSQVIDPWMEAWRPGVCIRRCDGETETLSGDPCVCAQGGMRKEDLCKPTVRVQLMLADVEEIGTWRLESHGEYAAGELSTLAPFIREVPMPVPAILRLRKETRKRPNGPGREFYVPYLHISAITPSQMVLGGDMLSKALASVSTPALGGPVSAVPAIEAGPAPVASAAVTTPTTGDPGVAPVVLTAEQRRTILGKIEEATTVQRLHEIAAGLVSRGVKDEQVKGALKSKAAGIAAGAEVDHQRSLKEAVQRRVETLNKDTREEPEYQRAMASGATHEAIAEAGGPTHWLAGYDQAQTLPAEYAVGDKITVAGIEFTKHAELPSTFDREPAYDADEEMMLLFTEAGALGWSTMDVHENIKKFCDVDRSADATGAALHGLRVMIKEGKFN
jgi:hypothetical protein